MRIELKQRRLQDWKAGRWQEKQLLQSLSRDWTHIFDCLAVIRVGKLLADHRRIAYTLVKCFNCQNWLFYTWFYLIDWYWGSRIIINRKNQTIRSTLNYEFPSVPTSTNFHPIKCATGHQEIKEGFIDIRIKNNRFLSKGNSGRSTSHKHWSKKCSANFF